MSLFPFKSSHVQYKNGCNCEDVSFDVLRNFFSFKCLLYNISRISRISFHEMSAVFIMHVDYFVLESACEKDLNNNNNNK